eukprot:8467855-Pyramimonas_sp.AAC.1
MARASIETAVTLGTAVQGTSVGELETLRAMADASLGAKAAGRSRALALPLVPSPNFDPIYRATLEPVKAFMR